MTAVKVWQDRPTLVGARACGLRMGTMRAMRGKLNNSLVINEVLKLHRLRSNVPLRVRPRVKVPRIAVFTSSFLLVLPSTDIVRHHVHRARKWRSHFTSDQNEYP